MRIVFHVKRKSGNNNPKATQNVLKCVKTLCNEYTIT